MSKSTKTSAFLMGGMAALSLTASAGDWSVSVGASYRSFDSVSFHSLALPNYNSENEPVGVQGYTIAGLGAVLLPVNPNAFDLPGFPFKADFATFNGSHDRVDSSDRWAPVIGVEKALPAFLTERLSLSLVGNFQYYNVGLSQTLTADSTNNGHFTTYNESFTVVDFDGPPPAGLLPPVFTPGVNPHLPGLTDGTSVYVKNRFDMDLFVLDFGIKAATKFDRCPVALYAAVGPTLNIASVDSSQTQGATWNSAVDGTPTSSVPRKRSESELDFLPGIYGAVGISYKITQHIGIAAEYRYDEVFEDAGTSQAQLGLSGQSGQIKLIYEF